MLFIFLRIKIRSYKLREYLWLLTTPKFHIWKLSHFEQLQYIISEYGSLWPKFETLACVWKMYVCVMLLSGRQLDGGKRSKADSQHMASQVSWFLHTEHSGQGQGQARKWFVKLLWLMRTSWMLQASILYLQTLGCSPLFKGQRSFQVRNLKTTCVEMKSQQCRWQTESESHCSDASSNVWKKRHCN